MEYQLIDGKATATAIKQEIAEEVKAIVAAGGKQPHLAAVLVGHDGGSETYVKNKVIACEQCGFKSTLIRFEADVTEEELTAEEKAQVIHAIPEEYQNEDTFYLVYKKKETTQPVLPQTGSQEVALFASFRYLEFRILEIQVEH